MPAENSYIYLNLTKENIIYAYKNNYYLYRSTVSLNIAPR